MGEWTLSFFHQQAHFADSASNAFLISSVQSSSKLSKLPELCVSICLHTQICDLLIRQIGSWLIASDFSLKSLFNYPQISSRLRLSTCLNTFFSSLLTKLLMWLFLHLMIDQKKKQKKGKKEKKKREGKISILTQTHRWETLQRRQFRTELIFIKVFKRFLLHQCLFLSIRQ